MFLKFTNVNTNFARWLVWNIVVQTLDIFYLANHWHTLPAETLFITSKLKLGLFKHCFNFLIVFDSPKMGFVCNVEEKQPVPKLEQVIVFLYFIFNIVVIIYYSMQLFCIRSSNTVYVDSLVSMLLLFLFRLF